ncbi:hypothetical protein FALBO_5628 [Fusarium albosuccineum]|uniref:Uncharacterized protein n=1 Tax=Fusarium albosuccineum TaxID=1237068 RepID=A0A8H4PFC6_9HYPO|nr:hypothetical protein FALBO_5628 [Fusarium albosuccineum]
MAPSTVSPDNVSEESSHFLLQPLPSGATTPFLRPHSETDTEATLADQLPRPGPNHEGDDSPNPNCTGLLIREVATPHNLKKGHVLKSKSNPFIVWRLELLLLLLAYALLAAIVLILKYYDHREQPRWGTSGETTGGDSDTDDGSWLTLNTLIAVLATVLRTVLAFIAFEILAQLKWDWVSACFRPLGDLQLFDDASRGIYGSLRLLPVLTLRQPLALGAIVVAVISLGIGPITQQTLRTYQCQYATYQDATITFANTVQILDDRISVLGLDIGMQAAMHDAIVNPSTDSNIASLFNCPSGNCNFTKYADNPEQLEKDRITHASVGMCSRCVDIYNLVQGPMINPNFTLRPAPQMYTLPVPKAHEKSPVPRIMLDDFRSEVTYMPESIYMTVYETGDYRWARRVVPKDFMNLARWSIFNFSILAVSQNRCNKSPNRTVSCPNHDRLAESKSTPFVAASAWGDPTDYVAATCILYPCIKHYNAEVRNGTLAEKTIRTTALRQQEYDDRDLWVGNLSSSYHPWAGIQEPCWVNGTLYTSSNMSSSKSLNPNAIMTVQVNNKDWASEDIDAPAGYTNVTAPLDCVMQLPLVLISSFAQDMRQSFNVRCYVRCGSEDSANSNDGWYLGALLRDKATSVDTIRENIDSMAMRITTEMRLAGTDAHGEAVPKVKGKVWKTTVCVRITWSWLALPTATLALSTILLVCIIVKDLIAGNNGLAWKTSLFPFLLKDQPGMENMGLKGLGQTAKTFEVMIKK